MKVTLTREQVAKACIDYARRHDMLPIIGHGMSPSVVVRQTDGKYPMPVFGAIIEREEEDAKDGRASHHCCGAIECHGE